jgi:hemerythrin-like domain-containing protein
MLRDPSLIPLSHQHHNGLALCVLTERSLAEDPSQSNVERLARRCIDRFEVELTNHFEIEEQVLFPASASSLIAELIGDHRRLEGLVADLRKAPSSETLREFTALLRRHIRREENELFEQMQREIPREKLDLLGEEIDKRAIRICL